MIVYCVNSSELEESEFFPTKASALRRAQEFEDFTVSRYHLVEGHGREWVCLLLNGRGIATDIVEVADRDYQRVQP